MSVSAPSSHSAVREAPLPGWAGVATLFGSPLGEPGVPAPVGTWVALGVPFDGTSSSRPGAAEGPRAIRTASVVFSAYLQSLGETAMHDCRTGASFRYQAPPLLDAGDAHVFPTDVLRTYETVRAASSSALSSGARGLFLNGDHSCSYATFSGFLDAVVESVPASRVGYLTIDHHFDFGDHSAIHGPIYHGSNSRRVSELPGMRPENVAFIGMGDVTRFAQLEGLVADGHPVVTVSAIRDRGLAGAVRPVLRSLADTCDVVYVSVDVDVLDASVAPGTGHVTVGGLTSAELFDLFELLRSLPIGAIDVAEVAPRYDPSGRTAQLVARLLFEMLFRCPTA